MAAFRFSLKDIQRRGSSTPELCASIGSPAFRNDEPQLSSSFFQQPFEDKSLEPRPLMEDVQSLPINAPFPDAFGPLAADNLEMSSLIDLAFTGGHQQDDTSTSSLFTNIAFNNNWLSTKRDLLSLPDGNVSQLPPDERASRLKLHHDSVWREQYHRLLKFKDKFGHCCVPITFADQLLSRWVKRQRYQYKRYQGGKSSHIVKERILLLDSVGFIWNKHNAVWQEKFNELSTFKAARGHCKILCQDPHHLQLSTWAKCQRRQYKLFRSGRPSNMTAQRIEALNSLGFLWSLRSNIRRDTST